MSRRVVDDRELSRVVRDAVAEAFAQERKARANAARKLRTAFARFPKADAPKTGFTSVVKVARYLAVSKNTVYRAIEAGSIPSTTVGETIRVRWEDIHALHKVRSR